MWALPPILEWYAMVAFIRTTDDDVHPGTEPNSLCADDVCSTEVDNSCRSGHSLVYSNVSG
ncbi:MAG: hypothetical protein JXA08_00690 [Methanomicrobiaceae archaeon]|nr:hypothetical protein [Methanomicrobiaceae archaeon]